MKKALILVVCTVVIMIQAYNFNYLSYKGYYFEDTDERKTYERPYELEAQFDIAMYLTLKN